MVRVFSGLRQAAASLLAALFIAPIAQAQGPRFLPDDPLTVVPEVAVPGNLKAQTIDELYDFAYYSAKYRTPPPTPSLGVNTVGEVPDSDWFTNRMGSHSMSLDELRRGARAGGPPEPPYTVIAAKTEGVSPGFRMLDARHRLFFVKLDPPSNPEMATASDVMGALFFYALGYNVPENYIANAAPSAFKLSPKATITLASGGKYPMRPEDLEKVLRNVPRRPDGTIRVMASLATPGKILGPFRYEGTRSDDPNDIIPHQQRRDLRGLALFCAWLNHTDAKSLNSMDTLYGKGADARVRHHLLDFGAAFGSDSDIAKDPRHGREYFTPTSREQLHQLYTFGVHPQDWATVKYPHDLPAVGNFTADAFDPTQWRSNYPNPAFQAMQPGDAFWAAEKIAAFTDDDIRVIVAEGQFSNPVVTDTISRILIARRDAILRAWLPASIPVNNLHIEDGRLQFTSLSPGAAIAGAQWFIWDDTRNLKTNEMPSAASSLDVPSAYMNSPYIGCLLSDAAGHQLTAYFRHDGDTWTLVGLDRPTTVPGASPGPTQVAALGR